MELCSILFPTVLCSSTCSALAIFVASVLHVLMNHREFYVLFLKILLADSKGVDKCLATFIAYDWNLSVELSNSQIHLFCFHFYISVAISNEGLSKQDKQVEQDIERQELQEN